MNRSPEWQEGYETQARTALKMQVGRHRAEQTQQVQGGYQRSSCPVEWLTTPGLATA